MGKIQILTEEQRIILDEIKQHPSFGEFYLTGGTALSAFYLQHRHSEDLDLFTEKSINAQEIETFMQSWSEKHYFTFTSEFREVVYQSSMNLQLWI